MGKVLVIQGAGMNMRGKVQLETFGPMTLEEMNEQILGYAESLGMDIELMHSNIEGEVVNALYDAHDRNFDAALINPAGYTTTTGPIKGAISQEIPGDRSARFQPDRQGDRLSGASRLQGRGIRLWCLRI